MRVKGSLRRPLPVKGNHIYYGENLKYWARCQSLQLVLQGKIHFQILGFDWSHLQIGKFVGTLNAAICAISREWREAEFPRYLVF